MRKFFYALPLTANAKPKEKANSGVFSDEASGGAKLDETYDNFVREAVKQNEYETNSSISAVNEYAAGEIDLERALEEYYNSRK